MKNIGININTTKDKDGKILNMYRNIISKYIEDSNIFMFKDCIGLEDHKYKDLDIIIALGGDGTILVNIKEFK